MSCERTERMSELALSVLSTDEERALESHAAGCRECGDELASLRETVGAFDAWPIDVLRPSASLRSRFRRHLASEAGAEPAGPEPEPWTEPAWAEVAPGISCKILATDAGRHVVSMLVRLAPHTDYPPHTHAGTEELHLLEGELWIDGRKLLPGDFNRAEPGTSDARVWSETGCTCVLVTSTRDVLR